MEKIRLSTGQEVPPVKSLTDSQLWDLVLQPIYHETPEDIKSYLHRANEEFFNRKLQLKPVPFSLVS